MTPKALPKAPIWIPSVHHSGPWSPARLRVWWVIISMQPVKERTCAHHTPSDSIITNEAHRPFHRSYRPILRTTHVACDMYNGQTWNRRLRTLRWPRIFLHTQCHGEYSESFLCHRVVKPIPAILELCVTDKFCKKSQFHAGNPLTLFTMNKSH